MSDVNPHYLDHVVKLRRDARFRAVYGRAGLITADGFPVVMACRLRGKRVDRVAGSDLIAPISAEAARTGKSIYLFGSNLQVLAKASRVLRERNPGLTIAGVLAPPQNFDPTSQDASRCVATIGSSGADLCFVALGAPKQEVFADHGKSLLPNVSFICIGAGLDFIAGAQVRAPVWMQKMALEWLYRLLQNPRRLAGRYLVRGPRIFAHLRRSRVVLRKAAPEST